MAQTIGENSCGKLERIFSLTDYNIMTRILVLGCGGTGAYVVAQLSKLISVIDKKINLIIADGDLVEDKNILRQHFINADIGKNKAEVLAQRYSCAYGIQIEAHNKYVEQLDLFYEVSPGIIIGCVDNNKTRRLIHQYYNMNKSNDLFWIDSGNEERNGQVVCGFKPPPYFYNILNFNGEQSSGMFSLPNAIQLYPELKQGDKFNSELSCAERAMSSPQNIQTNITAANIIMNYVNKIINNEPIRSHCVEFNIDNVFSTKTNTKKNLTKK